MLLLDHYLIFSRNFRYSCTIAKFRDTYTKLFLLKIACTGYDTLVHGVGDFLISACPVFRLNAISRA
jgi:hypothetical protein